MWNRHIAARIGISLICLAGLFITNGQANEAVRVSAQIYESGGESQPVEFPSFSCDDEIRLKMKWDRLPRGNNELEILWVDSRGEVWARNEEVLAVSRSDQVFISNYWFAFERSMFERFFGFELGVSKKAGRWRIDVRLNGNTVLSKRFWVDC